MSWLPTLLADLAADDTALVVGIVAARLLVPLLIPRFPLVIVAVLILDAADQTILQHFTNVDTTETGPYQGYDKALDVYYLTIAYLSTMLNWRSQAAFRIARFLFFYRLVGVTLFELLDSRAMLLVFPNTFEYFFIAYELVRLRYEPTRLSARVWLLAAAAIWVFVKLPQEYWIHVAQLDVTDAVREHPVIGILAVVVLLALLGTLLVMRSRLPTPDWKFRIAADPPSAVAGRRERRFLSLELVEKVGLLTLTCVIFSQILPAVTASPLQVVIGVTAIVCANAGLSSWYGGGRGSGIGPASRRFAALLAVNFAFVFVVSVILADTDSFPVGHGLFFAYLITLIVWLYDSFRPVYDGRFELAARAR